ncbi:DUF928 domain-containing protein [Trichothermofontia sichuanensis B231]|uniref:DUF928 domain-containing protein n=1 Tax=Trichothermofontia sichuanensis TaxID=3045816 RepID=UPI0022459C2B|nr:DUF928 domain-containing protein [Trichothermofontia sichuanensis]UZQ54069.1 DUF928 domain-containing protein [Trichothermofontia sichuanensis B231]
MAWRHILPLAGLVTTLLPPTWANNSLLPSPPLPIASQQVSLEFPAGPRRSAPRSTAGGGIRGNLHPCTVKNETPFTALHPPDQLSTTMLGNPTLFVYVPPTIATAAQFTLTSPVGDKVYETAVTLPSQSGVMRLPLPDTIALATATPYRWRLVMLCGGEEEIVRGQILRVELGPEAKSAIAVAQGLQKAELYAQSEVWLDTLMTLAADYPQHRAAWRELLISVGLGAIADQPLLD